MCSVQPHINKAWTLWELGQSFLKYFRIFTCTWKCTCTCMSCWSSMAFSYQLNRLTEEELAKDAKEEFGETKNLVEVILWGCLRGHSYSCFQTSMKDLRTWMSKSPHLHSIQQDDVVRYWNLDIKSFFHIIFQVLKTFLRGCKFSMERTKVSDKTIDILCLGWLFF